MSTDAIVVLSLLGLVAFIALLIGSHTSCTSCGKFYARRRQSKVAIGARTSCSTETSNVPQKDSSGNISSYATKYTRYDITYTKFRSHYNCCKCEHEWDVEHEEQTGKRKLGESIW